MNQSSHREPAISNICIVCFGMEANDTHKQPWHSIMGIAKGIAENGITVTIITNAKTPPINIGIPIVQVDQLYNKNKPSSSLINAIRASNASRAIIVGGSQELLKATRFLVGLPTSLILPNQRFQFSELRRIPLQDWTKEWHILKTPLLQSLIPPYLLRRGLAGSGLSHLMYISEAAQKRHASAGLPPGTVITPRVAIAPFSKHNEPLNSTCSEPVFCYFGPPLLIRGVNDVINAFAHACEQGLKGRLALYLRVDCRYTEERAKYINSYICRQDTSVRKRIDLIDQHLLPEELEEKLRNAQAFILPFKITVSDVPLVIIEAALSGKPVLTLNTPGITEWGSAFPNITVCSKQNMAKKLRECTAATPVTIKHHKQWTDWKLATSNFSHTLSSPIDCSPLIRYKMICLIGVDGCGKTTILSRLSEQLGIQGHQHSYVWSRFRNYLSKPFLGLMRITGHNRKVTVNGVKIGLHEFKAHSLLARVFLWLQRADMVLDIKFRYRPRLGIGQIISDRCALDTLIDLCIDTGMQSKIFSNYGQQIFDSLPNPALIVMVQRDHTKSLKDRPDIGSDPHHAKRIELYKQLADRFSLPVLQNNGTLEDCVTQLCQIARDNK